MPLLKKLQTLAAKVESTIGTAETLTASEAAFNAYDLKVEGDIEIEDREAQGSFDNLSGVPGQRKGKISFKTDLGWSGTGEPTWASVLLPGCGYVASAQVYTPRSEAPGSNVKTLTVGAYINGTLKRLAGCAGNFKLVFPTGKMAYAEFEFQGVWQAPTDATLLAPTYPTDLPIRFAGTTTTYNSVAQCMASMTFDAGNEITMRECPATDAGFESAMITGRKPMITLDPEAQLIATEDRNGYWLAGSEYAFSSSVPGPSGTASDAALVLAAPKAQITKLAGGDRDGILIDEVELSCNKNGANKDQDVSLTFTDLVNS